MGYRLFLPMLILVVAAFLACAEDGGAPTSKPSLVPTHVPAEPARSLSAPELEAVEEFEGALLAIESDRDVFYEEFDTWSTGLVSCHPSSAREALREFAASFTVVSDAARNLPRASVSGELADLVIDATDVEGTALRNLRDRWQGGNIALFEAVEQNRAASGVTHNKVVDMSLALQQELRHGPTLDDIDEMDAFSESFDTVVDAWDDFHDSYAAFARRENRIEDEEVASGYEALAEAVRGILASIERLNTSEINEDIIERLQDAAEDELALLEFLAEFPTELDEAATEEEEAEEEESEQTDTAEPVAQTLSAPAQQSPSKPEATGDEGEGEGETPPATQQPEQQASSQQAPANGPSLETYREESPGEEAEISPREELAATIEDTQATLEELEQSITEFIDDDSAQKLEDLQVFDEGLAGFIDVWNEFYEGFAEWRFSEGGCDRVAVAAELAQFSRQAGELAEAVRDLPQSGPLVSVYNLAAESAEREARAFRALANSWTPFAVDVFKAVDDERASASRLRRQASIALEELRTR